ncbi:MAG: vWA domain-containing protein [Spirochaetia bacterium]
MLLSEAAGALAAVLGLAGGALDGWVVAESLTATTPELPEGNLKTLARRIAARTVLRRAHDLVGPIRPSLRVVRETMTEPFRGELEEEETLENLLGKEFPDPEDWVSARREARRTEVVLMMDTSLSMSGKNLALAAVAAAVLAFSVRSEDLAVVAFETGAHTLTRFGQTGSAARVVEQLLSQPARGFTNIAEGLATGRRELARARTPRRVGLLITDGVSTAGGDPLPEAALFPRLFVLLTEDYVMDEALCGRMARVGNGSVVRVKGYEDLPPKMLHVVTRLLR